MIAGLDWTRVRLTRWGQWCRGGENHGFPSVSILAKNIGESGKVHYGPEYMPPDIEEIDITVARLPVEQKACLITVYCRVGPLWWKAAKLGISRRTLRRRLDQSEIAVGQAIAVVPHGEYIPEYRGIAVSQAVPMAAR